MNAHPGLVAIGLQKTLGKTRVLRGVELVVEPGECVILRGGNGSGKTTLLRCLAGLARPDAGAVFWCGHPSTERAARSLIGLVAHDSHLYPHLTLRENLILTARLYAVRDASDRADHWLRDSGLRRHGERRPTEISQGMRRRASIARASIHEPNILLLDEPTAGLDDTGRAWLATLLGLRQERGQITCLVTHEPLPGTNPAMRFLRLEAGRIEAESWPDDSPTYRGREAALVGREASR